jgi:hypothetical protein
MRLRKRRDSETSLVATWVVIGSLIATLAFLARLGWELTRPSVFSNDFARCVLLSAASLSFAKVMPGLLLILSFGAATVAKNLSRIRSWQLIVGTSIIGAVAALVLVLNLALDDQLPKFAPLPCFSAIVLDGEIDGRAIDKIVGETKERLIQVLLAVAAWYLGVLATQLGLKLPKIE